MQIVLYSLRYPAANTDRLIVYEDSPRAITVQRRAIDDTQPMSSISGPPDSWPYADGDLIRTFYEQAETVQVYATRVSPFARFTVTAAPPASACDLDFPDPVATADGFVLTVTTSHGPFSSSIDSTEASDFLVGRDTYTSLQTGQNYTFYVRDALGCQASRTVYLPEPGQPTSVTNPPAGAILLRRRTLPSLTSPGLYRIKEEWYNPDPAVRSAALYFPADNPDPNGYSRPTTDIIDRWCLDPGVAPYREVQVTHDGTGGITLTQADNATACLRPCTLRLSLVGSPIVGGRGTITAATTGSQGALEFSLDGFQTPGATPLPATPTGYAFDHLKAGTYTVTVRETRVGGCTASATVTLVAPYGARYEVHFKDLDSTDCLLQVFEREYQGEAEELEAQADVVGLDWPGSATDHVFTGLVRGSSCNLALYFMYNDQLLPLFSGDERLHRVEYRRAGSLIWKGYLLPEQYDVAFLAAPDTFNLSASDGLGTLSTIPFTGSAGESLRGDWTLLQVLLFCLNKLDLALPLHALFNIYPSTATLGVGALEQIKTDVSAYQDDKGKPWDCGKVLLELLTTFQARICQENGAWWLERIAELTTGTMSYWAYSPAGAALSAVTRSLLTTIQPPQDGRPHWLEGSQRQSIRPAVGRVDIKADPGEPVNLIKFALPKNSDLPAAIPATWRSSPTPSSELLYQGKDKPPTLRLTGSVAAVVPQPQLGPWVQTPPASPVPLRDFGATSATYNGAFTISFTAKPINVEPTDIESQMASMWVGFHFGDVWVAPNLSFPGEDAVTPILQYVRFPDSKEVKVSINGFGASPKGPQPFYVRLVAPISPQGRPACTVDITDLQVTWENVDLETAEKFETRYYAETGQEVSRVDEALTLFHCDTPAVRRAGTLLDAGSLPVQGWQERAAPGQNLEIGDYVTRDRTRWQTRPAQVLLGTLRGQLSGPGALLTDPSESRPGVYVQTSTSHNAANVTWQAAAVQLITLTAPPETIPANAIYFDDLAVWQDEDGAILVYEDA